MRAFPNGAHVEPAAVAHNAGEGAAEGINPSDQPNGNDESGGTQLSCYQTRRAQDAGTNGCSDDDRNPKADAENSLAGALWGVREGVRL
jgi:hypothetical protein